MSLHALVEKWRDRAADLYAADPVMAAEYERCANELESSLTAPDGYVLLPGALTAANGAKGLLSGEFAEGFEMNCGECDSVDEDAAQHCDVCNGHGTYRIDVPVGWDTIKDIYRMVVENFALNPGGSRE